MFAGTFQFLEEMPKDEGIQGHLPVITQNSRPWLGMPSDKKSAVFFNIVQKAFDPPPLLFEHLSYFAGGVF